MNKEKWQEELRQLNLSESQKLKMKKSVKEMKVKRSVDWVYQLAVPSFIVVAFFCLYLIWGDKMNSTIVHQASLPQEVETDHRAFFNKLLYLSTIFILTYIISLVGYLVILKTKRWQQPWIVRWREKLCRTNKGSLILIPIMIVLIFNQLINLNFPIDLLKWGIAVLLLMLHTLILLWLARDVKGLLVCPHCHHLYSKKESRKVWRTMLRPITCPSCQQEVYYSKKSRKLSGATNIINLILLFVLFNLGLPFVYVFGCIAIYGIFVVRKFVPLLLELEDNEEFLW